MGGMQGSQIQTYIKGRFILIVLSANASMNKIIMDPATPDCMQKMRTT